MNFIDPNGLINISTDGAVKGAIDGNSIHANPSTDLVGPNNRGEHLPNHIHLGDNEGPRIKTEDFSPFSDKDERMLSREQKKFIKGLSDEEKNIIRRRQESVYKYGKAMGILGAAPFAMDSVTATCKQDPFFCAEQTPYIYDAIMAKQKKCD